MNQIEFNEFDGNAAKPMPFVGWTVDACYEFFDSHLRPIPKFSNYTFLAVDADCVQAEPPEIILGCDGADYNEKPEDPPKLKVMRQPIRNALEALNALEMHYSIPSERKGGFSIATSIFPPAEYAADPRAYKRAALLGLSPLEERLKEDGLEKEALDRMEM